MIILSLLAGASQATSPGAIAPADPELLEFLGGPAPRPNTGAPDPVELLEQIELPPAQRRPAKPGSAGTSKESLAGEPRS